MSGPLAWLRRARQEVKPALLLIGLIGAFDGLAFALAGVDGLLVGGAILGVALLIAHLRSEVLLNRLSECEIDPALRGELQAVLENLAQRAGIATPRLRVVSHPQPNAWVMGLTPNRSTVLVTSALLSTLTRDELVGVLAHELAHIRSRDTLVITIAAAAAACLAGFATVLSLVGIALGRKGGVLSLLGFAVGSSMTHLALALSREHEYRADEIGAAICGHPEWLIAALRKLDRKVGGPTSQSIQLWPGAPSLLCDTLSLLSLHPPVSRRIGRLLRQLLGATAARQALAESRLDDGDCRHRRPPRYGMRKTLGECAH